ncbi:porin [Bradyrhizobium elkanii]|uniref:porin n=1 Tax=Bradyrhizobium elkanii TaxID=29448 RepID=UPI000684A21A|nr:porin [Bradyrhizobium elkanii]
MKMTLISAASIFALTTASHADELFDIQAQSQQLREQNLALIKRLTNLEKRQRELEARQAKQSAGAERPVDSITAGQTAYKAVSKKASPSNDSLTWNGITLYGAVDLSLSYLDHAQPLSSTYGAGVNYLISRNSNGQYLGVTGNALSSSFIGLKGDVELTEGLSGVFNFQTGFNPWSGRLSDGPGSVAQNNGLPLSEQTTFGDSSKAGQPFNIAAYGGLKSEYGILTYGRQSALTSDGVFNYDPMYNSGAFSVIGFQGATGGAGDTENRIYDNSFKYLVSVGPFRAAAETQVRSGFGGATGNAFEGQIGGDYAGPSFDAIFSYVQDAISVAPLSVGTIIPTTLTDPGSGFVAGTISDNTSVMLLAKYAIGPVKLYGGYEHIQFANPSNPLFAGQTILGGYTLASANNTSFTTDRILQVFWTGARYAVRPYLDLSVGYYHEEQNSYQGGTPATLNAGHCTDASLSQCSGQLDAISFLADYRFAKRFDAYAGIMWAQVSNGLASGFLHRSAIDPTVGLRFQF